MAVEIITKSNKIVTLLNPSEKGKKYSSELRNNIKLTNRFQPVVNENGVVQDLTKEQRAYRAGYLDARKDNAKCHNAKKKKRAQKKRV